MKKTVLIVLALIICIGICACGTKTSESEPTATQASSEATQVPTSEPTEEPTAVPTAEPTAIPIEGTWTEKTEEYGGKAITVGAEGKSLSLWIRNAGGVFPAGRVSGFEATGLNEIVIHVYSDTYTFNVTAKMIDNRTVEIKCPEFPEYDGTYAKDYTLDEFIGKFKGTYSASSTENAGFYATISENNTILFAHKNGNDILEGPLQNFIIEGYNKYTFNVDVPEVKIDGVVERKHQILGVFIEIIDDETLKIREGVQEQSFAITDTFKLDK